MEKKDLRIVYMGTPEFVIPDQVIENELAAPNYLK